VKAGAVAIIPARYASSRLPGKPLLEIAGIPMVVHVMRRACCARLVSRVIVATDDERVAEAVMRHGGQAQLTSPEARSGTDRVAEVAASFDPQQIIVNLQGDEPLIDPVTIDAAIEPLLEDPQLQMSTTSEPIVRAEDIFDPNVVKVVTDLRGFALYFSRSPVPHIRSGQGLQEALRRDPGLLSCYRKHSGLYAYRNRWLQELAAMEQSPLERLESLEQLRALENGLAIRVVAVDHSSIGVDTERDYQRVKALMEGV
jgi:3-deoxy-manno-octulosonate cytidylyltransferase (CMP-KDO synthetase)